MLPGGNGLEEVGRQDPGLVFAAIAPHGGDIVEEIASDPALMAKTRAAMEALGNQCQAARPDTVVVLTPHGLIVPGAISVGATEKAGGILGQNPLRQIQAIFDTDLTLVEALSREADAYDLPLAHLVGNKDKAQAILPLDWGALVPLWFIAHPMTPRPQVLVLAPDRALSRETLVRCGMAIVDAAEVAGRRIALIASCDQGHAHDPAGEYGYHPAAAEHDRQMCEAIASEELHKLLEWPEEFLEDAKVDAYWQTLMLMGALLHTPLRGELLSYECPTYFGMAVAAYSP